MNQEAEKYLFNYLSILISAKGMSPFAVIPEQISLLTEKAVSGSEQSQLYYSFLLILPIWGLPSIYDKRY